MVRTNDDPPEEISASSNKSIVFSFSPQRCRISSNQIPEELLCEIFIRLPVKSLIRFRCLSKGMHRLIDSPIFIKNHNTLRSAISERDREYAIFIHEARSLRFFSVCFDEEEDEEVNDNLNRAKAIDVDCTFGRKDMIPMGWCCNGVFCFMNCFPFRHLSYVFWNPSNGTFRKVDCSPCLFSFNVSMGYDCVNDDYKIIRFIDTKDGFIVTDDDETEDETSLEVYSFRKDSWRRFPIDFPPGDRVCKIRSVCINGVMHWLWTDGTHSSSIAAFDLATETFTSSLPLPLEATQLQLRPIEFSDFRGRLCITFFPPGYPQIMDGPQAVWVMEEYGVASSWTKLYTLDGSAHGIPNFYFPNSRGRLLYNRTWLSWFDPQDSSIERIEFPGPSDDQLPSCTGAYIYVRNLVRLDQSWEP